MITSSQVLGLDQSHLVNIDDKHALVADARDAFYRMQSAAINDGIDLQLVSSYRSFNRQATIWNNKWLGKLPLYTLDNTTLDFALLEPIDKLHAILLWSALPGASRHHWGTDIDVYDQKRVSAWTATSGNHFNLVPQEYEKGGPCADLAKWLISNAHNFGFSRPYSKYCGGVAEEPWHLSYAAVADDIEGEFDIAALEKAIVSNQIAGLDVILQNLAAIIQRYTMNKG